MTGSFQPKLGILPPPQRALWDELGATPDDFVLYGDTAVALHLGHRQSMDFDFFGRRPFDPIRLAEQVPYLAGATVTQQEPNTLSATIDRGGPVLVSFFGVPQIARMRRPLIAENGVRVASLLDLAGTKAAVVQQRAEAKDYRDLHAMLEHGPVTLAAALATACAIYGPKFNPQITLKALSYFGDGNLPSLPLETRDYLAHAAREMDLDRLPAISPEVEP
ncbi:MAG TPA: nucleotidyl transferase AbiEii/AbiGii toxin family protein [Bryobacteraceae bacterium]|jgi:hypothetical protein|nr:nucleotidyl transferase AbiEii/AbiGii toxin family protein [Bryobacteraceae bacterium]